MIDQQEGTEAGASGDDLGAPFSLPVLFTHHRHRLVVVWPAAIVRVAPLPVLPLLVYTTDANSG